MATRKALAFGAALAWVAGAAAPALAATEQQKMDAINNGLAWLATQQNAAGAWDYFGLYAPAATGAAVTAFVSQQDKWGTNAPVYQAAVDKAVNYLLTNATTTTVSTRGDGVNICPGGGSCTGVYWNAANNEDSYTTGLITPALMSYAAGKANQVATSSGPLAGMKWGEIAQGITNLWSASQAFSGVTTGGWRYMLGNPQTDADMSTTQWGIISLIYNQTMGAQTPTRVTDDLKKWLAFTQAPSGAGCYQGPGSGICNHSDTGGLLLGLAFTGQGNSTAAQKAIAFLNTNWKEGANNTWWGNFGHPYAMWSVYKGLETTIGLDNATKILNLLTTCGTPGNEPGNPPGSTPCNWWEDYNDWLVNNQNANGSWSGYSQWLGVLATAFDINILGATQIPVPPIPEPATLALLVAGLAGVAGMRRKRA